MRRRRSTARARAAAAAAAAAIAAAAIAVAGAQPLGDLNPAELRCCVLVEWPYMDEVRDSFVGLGFEYLEMLQKSRNLRERLGDRDFACKTMEKFDVSDLDDYDRPEFTGFSGLTRYFADCSVNGSSTGCKYDLAVAGFAVSKDRFPRVHYVAPFAFDSLSVVQRTEGIRRKYNGLSNLFFIAPFHWQVWLGIVAIIILHTFVMLFDLNFMPSEQAEPRDATLLGKLRHRLLHTRLLRRVRFAFFETMFTMVGAESGRNSRRTRSRSSPTRQRLLKLIAVLMGLFLTLVYESGLVVQLFRDERVSDFTSIDEIKDCTLGLEGFCVPAGGVEEEFFNAAIEPRRSECRDKFNIDPEDDKPKLISTKAPFSDPFTTGLGAVNSRDCKYFMASTNTLTVHSQNEYCGNLTVVGDPFFSQSIAFILPKFSPLTLPLSEETLKFHQEDRLKTPIEYGAPRQCNRAPSQNLAWDRLGVFFYIVYAAQVIMLIYMLIDRREVEPAEDVAEKGTGGSDWSNGDSAPTDVDSSGVGMSARGDVDAAANTDAPAHRDLGLVEDAGSGADSAAGAGASAGVGDAGPRAGPAAGEGAGRGGDGAGDDALAQVISS